PRSGDGGSDNGDRIDGTIRYATLSEVTLGTALEKILTPLGLAFRVMDDFIWVSTMANVEQEIMEPLSTRCYRVPAKDTGYPVLSAGDGEFGAEQGAPEVPAFRSILDQSITIASPLW